MIVLGIDPGIASTGYGVVKKEKKFTCLGYGLIQTKPDMSGPERLKKLNKDLDKLIKKYQPAVLAVENLFFFRNMKTAIPVSRATGVIIYTAAKNNIPVYEFSPPEIKLSVAGFGWSEKKSVQKKVKSLLKLKEIPKPDDAADGLAVALTYFRRMS